MLVIFGATGNIGGAAAQELRRRDRKVRVALRDVAKGKSLAELGCDIVGSDLCDTSSVARAIDGAEGVLVIVPLAPTAQDPLADAVQLIESAARAISAAKPGRVVVISDYGAHVPANTGITMIFHRLEQRFGALPVPMTFLRSAEHMHNWLRYVRSAREHGLLPSLHQPVDRLFPSVDAADVGRVAADLLAADNGQERRSSPRVVHVEGPRRISAQDVAQALAKLVGRDVMAEAFPRDRWLAALRGGGLGERYAQLIAELQDAHNAGLIDSEAGGEVVHGSTELADALARAQLRRARSVT
jgi:NAD(P)H dehydrogenase (quinone)